MKNKKTIVGIDRLNKKLTKLPTELTNGLAQEVARLALTVESDAKILIQRGVKSGRIYKRGAITHQSSAPGQPPASDTGTLASSIHTRKMMDNGLQYEIFTGLDYALSLEFGSRRIAARPFFKPALRMNKQAGVTRIKAEIKKINKRIVSEKK